jgi:hypothetical protein
MARKKVRRFLLCVNSGGYPASLESRKVYVSLPDADAEAKGFTRVIDESGEDYLYPESLFVPVELPQAAADAVLSAATGGAA